MQNAVTPLVATVFVGVLALLAQQARKSRGAEITLWVTLLFMSLLAVGVGVLLALVRFSGGLPADVFPLGILTITAAAVALAGVIGLGLCVPPILRIVGRRPGGFWSDPPIFLAVWLFVMVLLANNVVGILAFDRLEEIGAFSLGTGGRISPGVVLATQLPFVVVALLGVGVGVRRNLRQTVSRLGYGPVSAKQLGVVVLFVAAAFALSTAADFLFSQLQPGLYRDVGEVSSNLFDPTGLGPVSVVLFALLLGVGAGLGEETLLRGAVQPAIGILPTSVLFASMHVQYGPSVLLVYLFLLSIGLGLLRKHINTTASFLAHAAYNSISVILAYFFGA